LCARICLHSSSVTHSLWPYPNEMACVQESAYNVKAFEDTQKMCGLKDVLLAKTDKVSKLLICCVVTYARESFGSIWYILQ
jgi:hypothetical protein